MQILQLTTNLSFCWPVQKVFYSLKRGKERRYVTAYDLFSPPIVDATGLDNMFGHARLPAQVALSPEYVWPYERYQELGRTRKVVVKAAMDLMDRMLKSQILHVTKSLNLAGKNLSSLPDEVFLLPQLQEIHLEDNPNLELSATMMQRLEARKIQVFFK